MVSFTPYVLDTRTLLDIYRERPSNRLRQLVSELIGQDRIIIVSESLNEIKMIDKLAKDYLDGFEDFKKCRYPLNDEIYIEGMKLGLLNGSTDFSDCDVWCIAAAMTLGATIVVGGDDTYSKKLREFINKKTTISSISFTEFLSVDI